MLSTDAVDESWTLSRNPQCYGGILDAFEECSTLSMLGIDKTQGGSGDGSVNMSEASPKAPLIQDEASSAPEDNPGRQARCTKKLPSAACSTYPGEAFLRNQTDRPASQHCDELG